MVIYTYTVRVCRVFNNNYVIIIIKVLGNIIMLIVMNNITIKIRRRLL